MKRMLHLGCGPVILRDPKCDWVNVDIEPSHKPDLCFDYTDPCIINLLERRSFSGAYSVHSFEHLPFPGGVGLAFINCYNLLKPEGVLRLVVPDLMKVARKYCSGEDLRDIYNGPYYEGVDMPSTRFTYFMRAWSHTFIPDERILRKFMLEAGFRDVNVMPFHVSQMPEMCGLDRFESESICMECVR